MVFANVPFLNERIFGLVPRRWITKPFWVRLIELFGFYTIIGGIAYLLESGVGNAFRQGWEFFAVTACLFIVLAYPGFVFRYLRKRHG